MCMQWHRSRIQPICFNGGYSFLRSIWEALLWYVYGAPALTSLFKSNSYAAIQKRNSAVLISNQHIHIYRGISASNAISSQQTQDFCVSFVTSVIWWSIRGLAHVTFSDLIQALNDFAEAKSVCCTLMYIKWHPLNYLFYFPMLFTCT